MRSGLLIILFLNSLTCSSQKDGFEVLRIGKNFFDQAIADNYELVFSAPDSVAFRIQPKAPSYICRELIDYLNVKISGDSSITEVELYTVGRLYQSSNEFSNNYKSISQCMVSDFGKPSYLNDGRKNKDKMKTAGWRFPESNSLFVLYAYELPVDPNTVKRFYKMIWRPYNPGDQVESW